VLDWHHHAIAFLIRAAHFPAHPVHSIVITPAAVTTIPGDHAADVHPMDIWSLRGETGQIARTVMLHKLFMAHFNVRIKR
jgi:hypothetical protein